MLAEAARQGHLSAAHDVSDGGVAQTLVEACLRRGFGAQITVPEGLSPFLLLFSESAGRVVVSVRRADEAAFAALAEERGVPCTAIGAVRAPSSVLAVEGLFEIPLDELRTAYTETMPALFA